MAVSRVTPPTSPSLNAPIVVTVAPAPVDIAARMERQLNRIQADILDTAG